MRLAMDFVAYSQPNPVPQTAGADKGICSEGSGSLLLWGLKIPCREKEGCQGPILFLILKPIVVNS